MLTATRCSGADSVSPIIRNCDSGDRSGGKLENRLHTGEKLLGASHATFSWDELPARASRYVRVSYKVCAFASEAKMRIASKSDDFPALFFPVMRLTSPKGPAFRPSRVLKPFKVNVRIRFAIFI